ncbi:MAG: two-component regulator propeller domain-containing protein [Chitinophagaceae bacterium]
MRSIFFLFLIFLAFDAGAQLRRDLLFSNLGGRNGLVSEETVAVQQDDAGYIWIATADGLQRFEGRRFLTFRYAENDSTSIPSDNIQQMKLDEKNRLWLLFNENKIGYMNPVDLTYHEVPIRGAGEMRNSVVSQLMVHENGKVMLLLYKVGVFTYDEAKGEFNQSNVPVETPKGWNPIFVQTDSLPNVYWIACDSGLVKYDAKKREMSFRGHNPGNDPVLSATSDLRFITFLSFDHSGRLWLMAHSSSGRKTLLYSVDIKNRRLKEWDAEISSIIKDPNYRMLNVQEQSDGTVWVLGLNILAGLRKGAANFELVESNLPGPFAIRYDGVRSIYEDRENNLWVCTNKGLFRVNPTRQFFHAVLNGRPGEPKYTYPQAVTGICQAANGEIITSTAGNGMFRFNRELEPLPVNAITGSSKTDEAISCLFQRSNGDLWKATEDGTITIIHRHTGKTEKLGVFAGLTIVRQITEDQNGNMWIGTQSGRVAKFDSAGKKMIHLLRFKNRIMRLMPDNKGNLWVGVLQNGLFRVDIKDNTIADNYTAEGPKGKRLFSNDVYDMIRYSDSLYIIAAGGLNMLNVYTKTVSRMPSTSELPSSIVCNIIKDRLGYLWVTTQSGLCSVNMSTHVVTNYNERDGVHTNSFFPATSILLNDGRIGFGTMRDWMIFDPAAIAKNNLHLPPVISMTRIGVMGKWLSLDSLNRLPALQLNHDQNSITLEFSPLTFQSSYGIFYKMDGLDEEWQLSRQFHQAVYTYLPPGDYTFRAYCTNADGIPSKNLLEFRIHIKPPFWKTWWFLGILVLAGVCVLYWLDKVRMQKIRATESIRTRIATSLTEDMSNSLSNINISSELAKAKVDTDTQRTKEYISQISETSSRMVQAMYDMVWSINPESDTMADTIERMKVFAGEIESLYDINIGFDVESAVKGLRLNMEHRYELLSVFKEAVSNAGKHSAGTLVEISIRHRKSKLIMMIVDDGKGFVMDNVAMMGRGLSDMRRRASAINASFYIESEINTGTIVKMELPI